MKKLVIELLALSCLSSFGMSKHAIESRIFNNSKLSKELQEIGLKEKNEAAEMYFRGYEELKAQGYDTNVGTLALCTKLKTALFVGKIEMTCVSMSRKYKLVIDEDSDNKSYGFSFTLSGNIVAIYLYTGKKNTDNKNYCFKGLSAEAAAIFSGSAAIAIESKCKKNDPEIALKDRGFLVFVGIGYGVALDLSYIKFNLKEIKKFW